VVQGFGNAGSIAAQLLHEAGAKGHRGQRFTGCVYNRTVSTFPS
jgi:glutamate dehydrogenase/leucine dehydrogenase